MNFERTNNLTVIRKYPAFRDSFVNGSWRWIEGKRKDDYAEGLWRVHDKLYDLTDFVKVHPGGRYWLEITKGTDITEAFESHHISSKPSSMLKDFYVRDAVDPRNYFLTYDENGFYQTLKRRVRKKLETIDRHDVAQKSRIYHDVNLFGVFFAAVMLSRTDDPIMLVVWALLAGQFLAWCANLSHNFMHQADNWRMYSANIALITWRDFRVFHVLSHHMYPNTFTDFEVTCFDPYLKWIPTQTKSWFYMAFAIVISPVIHASLFHNMWRYRLQGLIWGSEKVVFWDELLTILLPIVMIIFGKEAVTWPYFCEVYMKWAYILITAQVLFGAFYLNRGHHGTGLIHQNDEIKSYDFGEFQLSTTVDRTEANSNAFTSLVYFGEQNLHHLFPALDSAILPHLKTTFLKTCKEFDVDVKPDTTILKATIDQFKQLFRSEVIRCT